jgi:hypothetical protein
MQRTCFMKGSEEEAHTFDDEDESTFHYEVRSQCFCGNADCAQKDPMYFCSMSHFIGFAYNMSRALPDWIASAIAFEDDPDLTPEQQGNAMRYRNEMKISGVSERDILLHSLVEVLGSGSLDILGAEKDDGYFPGQYL